ncbi:MAG TPA: endo-1,4-beta-xylanase, partial [Actinophytocola sp.]|uniref:endo-1,4-beta-xylanase n=1 Tax=Actinophytocola sp. TaxID=1872138 RepID=UPI002DDCD464
MKAISIAAVTLLAASILTVGLTASSADESHAARPLPVDSPLRDLAKRQHLLVGTAVDFDAFNADTVYRERIATEFSSITAENVMKWQLLEPVRGQLDFTAADALVASARRNGQQVRGHTLLWHNQLPEWLTQGVESGEITPAELRQILRQHIFDVASHFRGKLYQWDVVNEVIDDNAQLRDTIWLRNLGPGYIADAFRWAHQADPRVKLYLNDYNVEAGNPKSDAYFRLVKDLLRQGVPVHGFGAQGHLGVQFGFNTAAQVAANLRRFEDLGLETSLTEVDVRMLMPPDTVKLQAQAQGYGVLMQGCLLARRCVSFTVWGYTDKYSWVPGFFEG